MRTEYGADQLRDLLPHRHPFLLLDRVTVTVPGMSGIGTKNISISDPVFAGHFPGHAVYPGVLLIEAASHACGIVEQAPRPGTTEIGSPAMSYLAGVRKFSFKYPVVPGDRIEIHVRRKTGAGLLYEYSCQLMVGARTVAEGNIAVASRPGPEEHP